MPLLLRLFFLAVVFFCCQMDGSVLAQNDPALATPNDPASPVAPEPEPEPKPAAEEQTPESEKLPKFDELDWPTVDKLLNDAPEDWIVMHTGRVLQIPSLFPRPDHLGWLDTEQKKLLPSRPSDPAELPDWLAEYRRYNSVLVAVSEEGLESDYLLPVRHIDRILHHEDLVLKKAESLLEEGNINDARRLIDAVAQSEFSINRRRREQDLPPRDWPGLIDARRALITAEVRRELTQEANEAAFHLLTLYGQQDRDFPELSDLFGEVLTPLNQQLVIEHRYRELRYYLDQTRIFFPNHPTVRQITDQLRDLAAERIQAGRQAASRNADRQAALSGYEALWIWPRDAELTRKGIELQERYPILRTGVIPTQSTRDWYRRSLLDHYWFEIDSIKQGYPRYRSRFVESWIPRNLGRTVDLTFRLQPGPLESQPPVGSREFFEVLAAASLECDSESQGLYAPQLTSLARKSPYAVALDIRDQTPHPFNFLAAVLAQAPADRPSPLRQSRFTETTSAGTETFRNPAFIARRVSAAESSLGQSPVAEVQEFAYADAPALLRGFLRDEVDYLPDVPPEYVTRLQADRRFTVSRYQLGLTERLQFRLSGGLRDFPELRLAMCLMVDRKQMLETVAPADGPARMWYRETNSITPAGSHAYQPLDSLTYDPIAARSLVQLLRQKPKFPQQITLLAPADRDSQLTAEAIADAWGQLGLETRIVEELPMGMDNTWDVRLDASPLFSPWADLPGLLSDNGRITSQELESMPRPLRVSLLRLEQAYDWKEVNAALGELQRYLLAESWVFPLWERVPFQAARRELRNIPERVLRPAQSVDRWITPPQPPRL